MLSPFWTAGGDDDKFLVELVTTLNCEVELDCTEIPFTKNV